jgi:hypothetical protein
MASERSTIGRAGVCRLIAGPIQGRLGLWLKMIGAAPSAVRGTLDGSLSAPNVDTCLDTGQPDDTYKSVKHVVEV